MMIKNELRILRKENRLRSEFLNIQDQDTIQKMVAFMNIRKLSVFEAEVLRKDLIGMALEAESRGETLDSVIGPDKESFCREMTAGCRPRPFWEQLLCLGRDLSLYWLLYSLLAIPVSWDLFIHGRPFSITSYDLLFYLLWGLAFLLNSHYLAPRWVFRKWGVFLSALPPLIFLILLSTLCDHFFPGGRETVLMTVKPLWVFLPVLILFVSLELAYLQFIRVSARRFHWWDR